MKEILLGPPKGEPNLWIWGRPWSRWRTIRLWLLLAWCFSLATWVFSHAAGAFRCFEGISVAVIAVLAWPWIRGPYLLYTSHTWPLLAGYEAQPVDSTPPEFVSHASRALEGLGFNPSGVVTCGPMYSRLGVRVMLYVHSGNKDSAQVGHIAKPWGTLPVLVFRSRFDDGFAFETSNSRDAPILPTDRNFPVFRFPQLRSVSDQYRLHQGIKQELAVKRAPIVADKLGELNEFVRGAELIHQKNVSTDYRLIPEGDRYVLTLRGAIRRAWLSTWPVKLIRQLREERRGMEKATELGLPIHPKLGVLEESFRAKNASPGSNP